MGDHLGSRSPGIESIRDLQRCGIEKLGAGSRRQTHAHPWCAFERNLGRHGCVRRMRSKNQIINGSFEIPGSRKRPLSPTLDARTSYRITPAPTTKLEDSPRPFRAPWQGKLPAFIEPADRMPDDSLAVYLERAAAQHVRGKNLYGETDGVRRPGEASVFETFLPEARALRGKQHSLRAVVECGHPSHPIRVDRIRPWRIIESPPERSHVRA